MIRDLENRDSHRRQRPMDLLRWMVKITPVQKPGEKLEKDGHLGRFLYRKKN